MDSGVGLLQKIGDHFRALPLGMLGLEVEAGVLLVAFGGKANVVELHFVDAGLGYEFRQGDVIILHFGVGWIGPNQLAIFAPGLARPVRLHSQFWVSSYEVLVAEDCD